MTRIGSLFSGAGGLDMAVMEVFGGHVVWHCEVDPAAAKVLAHHWPRVPNLGDITAVDWGAVEPVDVLCGGYPCQPFSAAGQRKGTDDERHLWPFFAEAIRRTRPRYVVLENVAGHRSMGFDQVLADLAEARYDAQWCSVRASDVGAPHRRERLFVLASDADRDDPARRLRVARRDAVKERVKNGNGMGMPLSIAVQLLPTPNAQDGNGGGRYSGKPGSGHQNTLPGEVRLLPTPCSRDFKDATASPGAVARNTPSLGAVEHYLPTPEAKNSHAGPDYARVNREGSGGHDLVTALTLLGGQAREMSTAWGKYGPAIRRWEQIAGPAPAPTEPNKNGNPRLSAAFSEWLMGWPAGWVTDPAIGISRNDQLRIIGNGVVPQQAIAALTWQSEVYRHDQTV